MESQKRSVQELRERVREKLRVEINGDPDYAAGVEKELAQLHITAHNPHLYSRGAHSTWDERTKGYDDRMEGNFRDARNYILDQYGVDITALSGAGSAVLDIGIGTNHQELLHLLHNIPYVEKVFGIDIYDFAVKKVRENLEARNALNPERLSLLTANAEDLREEFEDNSIDLAFAIQSIDPTALMHAIELAGDSHGLVGQYRQFTDPRIRQILENMIGEMYRVIKPGGFAIVFGQLSVFQRLFATAGFEYKPSPASSALHIMRKPMDGIE